MCAQSLMCFCFHLPYPHTVPSTDAMECISISFNTHAPNYIGGSITITASLYIHVGMFTTLYVHPRAPPVLTTPSWPILCTVYSVCVMKFFSHVLPQEHDKDVIVLEPHPHHTLLASFAEDTAETEEDIDNTHMWCEV